jgi:outer membrane protein assembly factor BamB
MLLLLALSGAQGLPSLQTQDDWLHWRGPRADGAVESGDYPGSWDAPAWKVRLPGKGGSTPVVVGERVILTAPVEEQDAVLAFDLQGKPLWESKLGPRSAAKHKTLGSSCNASPVSDGRSVFVYFRSGRLAALDLDGHVRWRFEVVEKFGPEKLFWDQGSSPVVVGNLVVLARLHNGESWLAAWDKATGELRWKTSRTFQVPTENDNGYATPLVVNRGGKTELIVWGSDRLTSYDAADGRLVWSLEGFNPDGTGYWPAISTPTRAGDVLVVPVGRDDRPGQARAHGIRLDGTRAWKREDVGVFVPSPAVYQGKVYLLRHRGEIVCLDPATGATLWSEPLPRGAASYYASPLIAAGTLYAAREDGVVFTARVAPAFRLLGEQRLGERIVASPVPARGRVVFRGDEHLFAVE